MTQPVFDEVSFGRRLAETIAWCAPRGQALQPKQCLRSTALWPNAEPSLLPNHRAATVDAVATRRSDLVRESGKPAPFADGRLLVYFPDQDLEDGAAEVNSHGFFDGNNAPPWDTWIVVVDDGPTREISFRQYVVAWVPHALVACATAGIEVNPERCIGWLEATNVRARGQLLRQLRPTAAPSDDDRVWRPAEIVERYRAGERDFTGLEITGHDGSSFRGAVLEGADFSGAFIDADFSSARLKGCQFVANVKCCVFDGADLEGCNFAGAAICSATFRAARLGGATFSGATAYGYTFAADELPDVG